MMLMGSYEINYSKDLDYILEKAREREVESIEAIKIEDKTLFLAKFVGSDVAWLVYFESPKDYEPMEMDYYIARTVIDGTKLNLRLLTTTRI